MQLPVAPVVNNTLSEPRVNIEKMETTIDTSGIEKAFSVPRTLAELRVMISAAGFVWNYCIPGEEKRKFYHIPLTVAAALCVGFADRLLS
ncbi:hypothetical protein [Candidatus Endomicrobiellum agilis]|uniref:hypothetical protein n=1 Tax=Candidatus Endomicrobiellum agilis TaxID=3238957 RepID=UPI0035736D24|nr:hypothetical protein [Endomicrobium sp.]